MSGPLEVAREPDGRIGTVSKLVDYSVSLIVDVPEVHRMVSSRSVSVRALHTWTGKVKVLGCEWFHRRDSAMMCVLVKKR